MPLNPYLYSALLEASKSGRLGSSRRVIIRNEGRHNVVIRYTPALASEKSTNTTRIKFGGGGEGETYWVCCPACGDRRYRLCINHAWGIRDEVTGQPYYFPINCFNEGCQSSKENFRRELWELLFSHIGGISSLPIVIKDGEVEDINAIRTVSSPGPCVRIDELELNHPAIVNLRNAGHDIKKLASYFGVSYCVKSSMPFADSRIIFPVLKGNETVGWQARYIDNHGGGDCTGLWFCRSCKRYGRSLPMTNLQGRVSYPLPDACEYCGDVDIDKVPKYFTSPGFSKSKHLFNFDAASKWPFAVVCEGPRDPIHLGTPDEPDVPGPGTCIFGHKFSQIQRSLLGTAFFNKALVVMLDPDVADEQKQAVEDIRKDYGITKGVANVLLDNARDPAETSHDLLWRKIRQECRFQGVDIGI